MFAVFPYLLATFRCSCVQSAYITRYIPDMYIYIYIYVCVGVPGPQVPTAGAVLIEHHVPRNPCRHSPPPLTYLTRQHPLSNTM